MDTIKIDYHLSYYRTASNLLVAGTLPPKEFERLENIRQAALVAIALEIGVITLIGDGNLSRKEWEKTIAFINRYEEGEIQDVLDPNWMYDTLDEGLAA
jgi:hypothetical protein